MEGSCSIFNVDIVESFGHSKNDFVNDYCWLLVASSYPKLRLLYDVATLDAVGYQDPTTFSSLHHMHQDLVKYTAIAISLCNFIIVEELVT